MVSVVIPLYNVERYVERCLKSVLTQSYKDVEIVIVDDASTDQSLRIAEHYQEAHSNIRIFRHKHNLGPMSTRQDGYMSALGDFILFLDADDALPADAVKTLVERQRETGADIVMGDLLKRFTDGHTQRIVGSLDHEATDVDVLSALLACSITHSLCGKLFKATLFRQGVLHAFSNQAIAEDGCLFYQLVAKAQRLSSVREVVYDYYENKASTTQHAYRVKQIDNMLTAYGVMANVCRPYASLHHALEQRLTKVAFTLYFERPSLCMVRRLLKAHDMLPYGSIKYAFKYLRTGDLWFLIKRFIYVRLILH